MKHLIATILIMLATATAVEAQEERSFLDPYFDEKPSQLDNDFYPVGNSLANHRTNEDEDSLRLPLVNTSGQMLPMTTMPWGLWGWNVWQLHSGLNVNVSASVMAEFGSGRRHGAGFGQSVAAVYAMPLSNKLSVAIGGYVNNMQWGDSRQIEGGLNAILNYRFNDKLEAYIYAQKAISNNRNMRLNPYHWGNRMWNDWSAGGDRIGAGLRYTPNPSFSLEVQVEAQRLPNNPYYGYYPARHYNPYWW